MAQPELRITFKGRHGEALSGRCSVCNASIDRDQPPNKFETIEDAFKLHVKQKHSREDVDQAVAPNRYTDR